MGWDDRRLRTMHAMFDISKKGDMYSRDKVTTRKAHPPREIVREREKKKT